MRHFANIRRELGDRETQQAAVTTNVPSAEAGSVDGPAPSLEIVRGKQSDYVDRPQRLSQTQSPADRMNLQRLIDAREKRTQHFGAELFADPAWDMLLGLALAEIEQRRMTISCLSAASLVPDTTALRWINTMEAAGVFLRFPDPMDRRRVFIELSQSASLAMKIYLAEIRS